MRGLDKTWSHSEPFYIKFTNTRSTAMKFLSYLPDGPYHPYYNELTFSFGIL